MVFRLMHDANTCEDPWRFWAGSPSTRGVDPASSKVDVRGGLRCLLMTEGRWPLVLGPARLIPAGRTAGDHRGAVHLGREVPGTGVRGVPMATSCGREAISLGVDVDLEVLGADRDRLCGSCWRVVEGWLVRPPWLTARMRWWPGWSPLCSGAAPR